MASSKLIKLTSTSFPRSNQGPYRTSSLPLFSTNLGKALADVRSMVGWNRVQTAGELGREEEEG